MQKAAVSSKSSIRKAMSQFPYSQKRSTKMLSSAFPSLIHVMDRYLSPVIEAQGYSLPQQEI